MIKLKIVPINVEKASDVKGITKNISEVVDFQIATSLDINRVIKELNAVLPTITKPFDDKDLQDKIVKLGRKITPAYDDSEMKKAVANLGKSLALLASKKELAESVASIKKILPVAYDDTEIRKLIASVPVPEAIKSYDDREIKKEIDSIKGAIPNAYDDGAVTSSILLLVETVREMKSEIESLKAQCASNQKEVRSNRKESGLKIDILEQKVNAVTEIK